MALVTVEVVPSAGGRKQLAELQQEFVDLGFQIGPKGPASFSIVGAQDLFERTFKQVDFTKALPPELAVASLPTKVRPLVERMVITIGYGPFGA